MRNLTFRYLVILGGLLLAFGCAKQPPREVTDLNRMWTETRDECATVYEQDAVRRLEPDMNALNLLVADGKYRKAAREAETLQPRLGTLRESASKAKAAAKRAAEKALTGATDALARATTADAGRHAGSQYGSARDKLERARREMDDPCGYNRALDLAGEAERSARDSVNTAVAEKARLEEERRRAEQEARRLAEERRRREKPSDYTVEAGNSLWRIAGMEKIYGDPLLWPLLYEANLKTVRDPDLIYPNRRLAVPREIPTGEMHSRAQRFYRSRVPAPGD